MMAFLTKRHLSRRTFLRGAGVTLALPFLDSMLPAGRLFGQSAATRPTRFGAIYFPHGAIMPKWTPASEGANFELTEILQPLKAFQGKFNVISDLELALAYGSGATANHNRGRGGVSERGICENRCEAGARRHRRSDDREEDRPGDAAAVARADDRRSQPELR
jgi:hypothetical protein